MDEEFFERVYFRLLSYGERVDGLCLIRVSKLRYVLGTSFHVPKDEQRVFIDELVSRGFVGVHNKFYFWIKFFS